MSDGAVVGVADVGVGESVGVGAVVGELDGLAEGVRLGLALGGIVGLGSGAMDPEGAGVAGPATAVGVGDESGGADGPNGSRPLTNAITTRIATNATPIAVAITGTGMLASGCLLMSK